MSQPERDMDERVKLPEDAAATLKALLAVEPVDDDVDVAEGDSGAENERVQ